MQVVDSYRIDLPDTWTATSTEPSELRRLVEVLKSTERWAALPTLDRRRVELFIQRLSVDMEDARVQFVGLFSDVDEPESGQDPSDAASTVAAMLVSVLTSSDMGSDLPLTPYVLQAALSLPSADGPVLQGSKSRNLEPPSVISLPSGQCTRARRIVEQRLGDDELVMYTDTFFVPIPDAPDRMVLLQFSTPHIDAVELFAEYFHELAKTLRFYREGEETEL